MARIQDRELLDGAKQTQSVLCQSRYRVAVVHTFWSCRSNASTHLVVLFFRSLYQCVVTPPVRHHVVPTAVATKSSCAAEHPIGKSPLTSMFQAFPIVQYRDLDSAHVTTTFFLLETDDRQTCVRCSHVRSETTNSDVRACASSRHELNSERASVDFRDYPRKSDGRRIETLSPVSW